jgi:hypothetical protein
LRAYCGTEEGNPDEARFLQRLQNPASREYAVVQRIVAFAATFYDTV